jgi:hypothetical protein
MILKTVYVRFYRSFNYDYLRKNHPAAESKAKPWDKIDNAFFPYVRIPVDEKLTTVVGANESGKSHLLSAIEKGVSGVGIQSSDFCRYSQYFTVTKGEMRSPDFGFEWAGLSNEEKTFIREICELKPEIHFESFLVFRTSSAQLDVFLPSDGSFLHFSIAPDKFTKFTPRTFRINAEIALPDSVPIRELAQDAIQGAPAHFEGLERERRFSAIGGLQDLLGHPEWFATQQTVAQAASHVHLAMHSLSKEGKSRSQEEQSMHEKQVALARDLICKVAKIDQAALQQLHEALRKGDEGHANGIIDRINKNLASRLNFPRVWVQDREFALMVSPREHDLVFTIRDRTNTEYSFGERSSGLKYFLSYYIQYLAHEPQGVDTEILLMDEPDAYLSSQAQQDLLKIFKAFADGERGRHPVQVIYVTHSPFLIDKNHSDRIRVLEKGTGDEGTRVVRNASRNHYEPLRSAFGAFVGETTFIGNCNVMVEGAADQILLGGATVHLRLRGKHDSETLDLNHITLVPAGSASHIPYLVYLARGRDVERPAVVVLLDSDNEGKKAYTDLLRGGARGKQLLKSDYILQIGNLDAALTKLKTALNAAPIELEDLIPLKLCARAAQRYAKHFLEIDDNTVASITAEAIFAKKLDGHSVFDALEKCVSELQGNPHIDKIGFARAVVDLLPKVNRDGTLPAGTPPEIEEFETNMLMLLTQLRKMQRASEKEQKSVRISEKTDRLKRNFLQDHPEEATREQAVFFIVEIEAALDEAPESDLTRIELQKLRRDFLLSEDLYQNVPHYDNFKIGLERVKYAGVMASKETVTTLAATSASA